ncbi:MAG: FAD-dependent oxidoreductase, partial [Prevotella sp.]|nr:FAD-dependent oxidoreductase [Prevotella sp.]
MMMSYGRLPNGKYMINWPMWGNDYYLNDVDYTPAQRDSAEKKAKAKSLRFLYFMQNELEMHNLGLANEYPTADGMPFFPYYREGRRFAGRVLFTLNAIISPYEQPNPRYRTAVLVGDYPVDQHHNELPVPDLILPSIPSWGMPLGVFFPRNDDRLILAEKAISVTNLVNGTSRLQPVVMQIGQVAGTLAGMAVKQKRLPCRLSVRDVQRQLLKTGNYLLPFLDVKHDDALFPVLQRIGATGILQGRGRHHDWSNETWLDIDSVVQADDVVRLLSFYSCPLPTLWPNIPDAKTMQKLFDNMMKAR